MTNCPNCGAPITQERCAYCGTVFLEFASILLGKPSYVKFKADDKYIRAKLVVDNLELNSETETLSFYDGLGVRLAERAVWDEEDQNFLTLIIPEEAGP